MIFSPVLCSVVPLFWQVHLSIMEKISENVLDQAVNYSKLLKDVAEIGIKFVQTSKTKLTEDFRKLTN